MRIMMITIGTAGDVFPFVGLARALVGRGHEVHLASLAPYRRAAETAGLHFREVSGVRGASGHPDFYHRTRSMRIVAEHVLLPALEPVFALASNLGTEWGVIADPYCYGARIAQDLSGSSLVTCVVSPFILRSIERMPITPGVAPPAWAPKALKRAFFSMVTRLWDHQLQAGVNAFRRQLGLPAIRDIFYGWALSPDRVIGLFPEWFAPRAADWAPQFVHGGFTVADDVEGADLPEALRQSPEPIVVFSAGSAGAAAEFFFSAAVDASRGRPWRAVLLGPDHGARDDLPPNVACYSYVPLSRLLPLASAVVFHGGLGTMSLALAAGTPQIVVPFGHDQYDNAARVERLGVARRVRNAKDLARRLAAAVDQLLGDTHLRDTARRVAAEADSRADLMRTCDEVERTIQTTARHGSRRRAPAQTALSDGPRRF